MMISTSDFRSYFRRAVYSSLLLISGWSAAWSADSLYPVVTVPAPDHVVVLTKNFPVVLSLAHVAIPDDDASRAAAQKYLAEKLKGKRVSIIYTDGFGTDASGAAKVHFLIEADNVNAGLVGAGLARFQEGTKPEPAYERVVRSAEEQARKSKTGLWKGGDQPKTGEKPSQVATQKKGPFVSELDTPYFFASDSADAAKLNPQRVIYYPDEATAQRAGKKAKANVDKAAITSNGSLADADKMFAKGQDAYNAAIDKGNTPERDVKYEEAYQYLTKAMQDYTALVEKKPNDEALGEKLRKCMQLRYGTVKQRRFH
jgi:Staphylococcal nuclease homologue